MRFHLSLTLLILAILEALTICDVSARVRQGRPHRLSARRRRTRGVFVDRTWSPSRTPQLPGQRMNEAHAPHDFDINDEAALAREKRRLSTTDDHEDVPTDIEPLDEEVEADWEHDFDVMKSVLDDRGVDTSGATTLCQLPKVYCDFGYRRRMPTYVQTLKGSDWVGSGYQVILDVVNETHPSPYPAAVFNLRRAFFLHVEVNTGSMPAGIENLPTMAAIWITGLGSAGLEGDLPAGFWDLKARMLAMSEMPSTFTGSLEANMGVCDYVDYRWYTYNLPAFTGDIAHLSECTKIQEVIEVFDTAVYGNAWAMMLNLPNVQYVYELTFSAYTGTIPYADLAAGETDPWIAWCEQKSDLHLSITQEVNGPLPAGFAACSNSLNYFDVSGSGLTGSFPLNFSNNSILESEAIILNDNAFTGPLPDVPSHVSAIWIYNNRWSGDLPASWRKATKLTALDLSGCQMSGEVPSLTPYIEEVDLSNNLFSGFLPDSWKEATSLETIDLSNNAFAGPIFPWGWQGDDPYGNAGTSLVEAFVDPPEWQLKSLTVSNNPMGISVGFFLGFLGLYSLTEVYASNCSLMGYLINQDLVPNIPLENGGTITADGVRFMKLRTLDLSDNPSITSFGYTSAAGHPDTCWVDVWDDVLPELSTISFSDCTGLLNLPNKVYSLSALYIDGATSLQVPEVFTSPDDCDEVFGTTDPLCTDGTVEVCLYLSPVYSDASDKRECGQVIAEREDGTHASVQVDSTNFVPETLCRCQEGYEWEEEGYSCRACPADSYATADMTACASCPDDSTTGSLEGSTSIDACSCSAGLFLSNGLCEQCPESTYSAAVGAVSISACVSCQGGTVTASKGSSSSDDCICPAGLTKAGGVCVECEQGRFKSSLGDEECELCPSRLGVQLTTLSTEAAEESECVCPAGTYSALGSNACSPCPEGMTCSQPNSTEAAISMASDKYGYPQASPGYMTRVQDSMKVYKCWNADWCPGGAPGSCYGGRDASTVGCGSCPQGTYTQTDGDCAECNQGLVALYFAIAIVAALCALAVLAFAVNKQSASETKSMTNVMIVAALTLTAIQSLGVLSSMAVTWAEPVRSMLKALEAMSFDLNIVQAECMIGQSPARSYGIRQLLTPGASLYIVALILLRSRFYSNVRVLVESVNAIGAVFQAFFVSILVSIMLPFVCYSHPGDVGSSMTSDPSIMCFSDSEHTIMIALGCFSLLVVAVPFVTLVTYATCRYRQATADSSTAMRHLSLFRFLFFRYKPEAFYYSSIALTRSCLICLLPVVIRDALAAQIEVLTMIFLSFLVVQLYVQPWRSDSANLVDAGLSGFIVMIIVSVALVGTYTDAETVSGITGTVVLACIFVLSLFAVAHATWKRLIPSPFFQKFICHHKADAAAQARYLQMMIAHRLHESCFIDSDHLSNLDNLLDVVRCRTGILVVYCTSDTLRRPWCAAEVATTSVTHRRAVRILTESFCPPRTSEISADAVNSYIHQSDVSLDELGIFPEIIAAALDWLLHSSEVPEVSLSRQLVGLSKFQQVVDDIARFGSISVARLALARRTSTVATKSSNATTAGSGDRFERDASDLLGQGMLVISSQPDDDEATAAAGIVAGKIGVLIVEHFKRGMCLLANLRNCSDEAALQVVSSAKAVIIILSKGSLRSTEQLAAIFTAVHTADMWQSLEVVPVFTPDFRFVQNREFENYKDLTDDFDAAELLHSLFKRIAIGMATHASDHVLEAQCQDIANRLPRETGSESQRVSSKVQRLKTQNMRISNVTSSVTSGALKDDDDDSEDLSEKGSIYSA